MVANFCVGMKRGSSWSRPGDDEEEEKNITDVYVYNENAALFHKNKCLSFNRI